MQPATKQQVKAINAILAKRGLMEVKKEMIAQYTGGRTNSSRALTIGEAAELLVALNKGIARTVEEMRTDRMQRKVIAIAIFIGMVVRQTVISPGGQVVERKDYAHLNSWLLKYGYLHKPLHSYTSAELPNLISQLEILEKQYLGNI